MPKKVVPIVPKGDGNIEHPPSSSSSPCYKYDFVINNYKEDELFQLYATITEIAKKAIVGKEIGESGTPHLQCYINLKKKLRMKELSKIIPKASFRPCRNEDALIEYCKKEKNYWSIGFPRPVMIINNLYEYQKKIESICLGEVDDRKIYWYYDKIGNKGKSAFTKYMIVKHKALLCQDGKSSDIKNLVFNNNMDECSIVIFDLSRCNGNHISYNAIESIKNGMVCNTKYETGVKIFNSPHVIVFANEEPDRSKLSADRWVVEELI